MARGLGRLLWLEPLWVALLALPLILPGRFLPIQATPLLVLLLFVFWPLRLLDAVTARHRGLARPAFVHALSVPMWVLLATLPVSYAVAADPRLAWVMMGYLCVGITLSEALMQWPVTQQQPRLVAWFLVGVALLLSLVGPALLQRGAMQSARALAFFAPVGQMTAGWGETINANILAGGLVLAIPIVGALAMAPWDGRWGRPFAIGRTLALLGLGWWLVQVLTLTNSRGGLLATGVALGLVVVLRWPRLWRGAPAVAGIGVIWLAWRGPWQMLQGLMADGLARDYNSRMEIWVRSWQALVQHPLTGIGLGGFDDAVVLGVPLVRVPLTTGMGLHAHNLLLQVGVDLGFVGSAAYVAVVVISVRLLWQAWRSGDILWRTQASAGLGASTALLVHGLVDAPLWNSKLAWMPWLIFALAVLLGKSPANLPQQDVR